MEHIKRPFIVTLISIGRTLEGLFLVIAGVIIVIDKGATIEAIAELGVTSQNASLAGAWLLLLGYSPF